MYIQIPIYIHICTVVRVVYGMSHDYVSSVCYITVSMASVQSSLWKPDYYPSRHLRYLPKTLICQVSK